MACSILAATLTAIPSLPVVDTLTTRAQITRNYEHKGHKWVELNCMVVANETKPVIQATHIAIYRPRQLAEAA